MPVGGEHRIWIGAILSFGPLVDEASYQVLDYAVETGAMDKPVEDVVVRTDENR